MYGPTHYSLGYYNFPRSTNKFNFLMKFPHLEKNVDLMKDLKYEHQSIFPMWRRSKLILGPCMENQISILRTPATIKFFSSNSQK